MVNLNDSKVIVKNLILSKNSHTFRKYYILIRIYPVLMKLCFKFYVKFQKFEKKYQRELQEDNVSNQTQFEYAWCLVRSDFPSDIKKVVFFTVYFNIMSINVKMITKNLNFG